MFQTELSSLATLRIKGYSGNATNVCMNIEKYWFEVKCLKDKTEMRCNQIFHTNWIQKLALKMITSWNDIQKQERLDRFNNIATLSKTQNI